MRWVIDGIEDGIAVLESIEAAETAGADDAPEMPETLECPKRELPKGAREGQVLTDDGIAGGPLRIDREATAARAARIRERFERLKADG
jgi:hypothetical protein